MNADWYPGIQAFCSHWRHAPMFQQTLDTLEGAVTVTGWCQLRVASSFLL